MKAMILAAGRGTRMKDVTQHTPKALLLVANKALILHHLENLQAIGVNEVVINLCHHGDKIQAYLDQHKPSGMTIYYSHESEPLETGGGIYNALPLLGKQKFILLNCDVYTDFPLRHLLTTNAGSIAHLILVDNPPHNSTGDFALEKQLIMDQGAKKLTYAGLGIMDPKLFEHIENPKFSLLSVLQPAIKKHKVTGKYYDGIWVDVGTPERLDYANQIASKTSSA